MSELIVNQDNNSVLARAEIDTMIATAKAYPRNVTQALQEATTLATLSEEVAASCFYVLPRKDKDGNKVEVKGASIRLAEIMVACWGNIHAATRIVEVAEKHIVTEGVCWDLEKNVRITMPDKVSIWFGEKAGKGGYRANNDMQVMLTKASCSKALRNAVFRVIPKTFIDEIYKKAIERSVGDVKTLSAKTNAVVDRLVKMGVNKQEMLDYFGHSKIDDFTAEDLAALIGIGTALKEKMLKPEEVFSVEKRDDESASSLLNDLIASKKAPQIESHVNVETGEITDGA